MPKVVSRAARREEVADAAVRVLARGGPSALTLRSLAAELGGSITLVTYFFDDRDDLFEAIIDDVLLRDYSADEVINRTDDPLADLRSLMEWFMSSGPEDDEREAGRIALISMRAQSRSVDHFFEAMENKFRELFGAVLDRLVPANEVQGLVDYLRVGMNGIAISAVEHPEIWTPERRKSVVDLLIQTVEARRRD